MHYTVKQEKFEGPLDLLLELIQKRELSINEISLAEVTDEFIAHFRELETRGEADPEMLAEFLVVASQLLLIKSRSLLPQFEAPPEEETSIRELEDRLAEYQRIKNAAKSLGEISRGGPKSFSREAFAGFRGAFLAPAELGAGSLAEAFRAVMEAIPKTKKLLEERILKVVSLEEKIKELQAFLQKKVERVFSELVSGAREKVEVIVSFLAILELAKQRLVTIEQGGLFQEITIRRRE